MAACLEARAVSKTYHQGPLAVAAVQAVSLAVEPGETVLLIGPSGSGKSTLLSMLGCMLRPSAGSVLVDGATVSDLPQRRLPELRRRCFGFVFQEFNLLAFLTARENVEAPLRLQSMPRAARRERALLLLSECGLARRAGFHPGDLSGGEKQRVAIARALAGNPSILLADEPTASLDSATGETVLALMRRLAVEHGTAVVMASHDPKAQRFADRVLTLVDGRVAGP